MNLTFRVTGIRYDTIEEINVDSKGNYNSTYISSHI